MQYRLTLKPLVMPRVVPCVLLLLDRLISWRGTLSIKLGGVCSLKVFFAFMVGGIIFPAFVVGNVQAEAKQGLKIAVVDMNRILNESKAGRGEKNKLLAKRDKLQKELSIKETEFKEKVAALDANLLLTEEARKQEELKLRRQFQELQAQMKDSQADLSKRELVATQRVFKKAERIVRRLAKEGDYDLVLERTSAETVLYTREPLEDITKQVISEIGN